MRHTETKYVENLVRYTIHGYDFSMREVCIVAAVVFVGGIWVGRVFFL